MPRGAGGARACRPHVYVGRDPHEASSDGLQWLERCAAAGWKANLGWAPGPLRGASEASEALHGTGRRCVAA